MFISKLSEFINKQDPYGQFRVNAFQTLVVLVCLFFVNFIFSPPHMQDLIAILSFGFIGSASMISYNKRQYMVAAFCIVGMIYAILINLVREYNLYTVLMVGFGMSSLFWLSRKIPMLAGMAAMVNMLGITMVKIKVGGNSYVYFNYIVLICFYLLLALAFMNIFPRIYYFRIWLRAYYLALGEFEIRFRALAHHDYTQAEAPLTHFIRLNSFTRELGYKEFGFSARRIDIILSQLCNYLIASRNNVVTLNSSGYLLLADACKELQAGISDNKSLNLLTQQFQDYNHASYESINTNLNKDLYQQVPMHIISAFAKLTTLWNQLCLKM